MFGFVGGFVEVVGVVLPYARRLRAEFLDEPFEELVGFLDGLLV